MLRLLGGLAVRSCRWRCVGGWRIRSGLLWCDHADPEVLEGVLHALVVGGHACKLLTEAECAGDVDGVKCADVYRLHFARCGDDALVECDDRGGGKHTLQYDAAIDHRVSPLLTGARQLDLGDDAAREICPRQKLALNSC
jgi:hypothetical protein